MQGRLGLYRVALAAGDYRRGDSLLVRAVADARRIGDRGGEMDALIGFANTRGAGAGLDASFAVLDSLRVLLPPGDGWERVNYLCRLGILRGIRSDSTATDLTARGIAMADRLGERRLTGQCFEAHALAHSLLGHSDSALANMDRSEALLAATRDHASLARLASRRSDELQSRGRLGEARAELRKVLAHAEFSRNRERFAFAYGGLGSLALRLNDLPTAVEHFDRAAALYDSLGQEVGSRIARQNRAWVLSLGDDLAAARAAGEAALAEVEGTGDLEDEVYTRQLIARVAIRQGDLAGAARRRAAPSPTSAGASRSDGATSPGRSGCSPCSWPAWPPTTTCTATSPATGSPRPTPAGATWGGPSGSSRARPGSWRPGARRWGTRSSGGSPSPPRRWGSAIPRRRWPRCSRRWCGRDGSLPRSRSRSSAALLEFVAGTEGAPTTVFVAARQGLHAHLLSPADLAALRLDADLVVLSACRTAGGVAITGEGMEGLTSPLVAAGARSVVATQWRIADRSTVRLVGDFYGAMAKGLPVAEALREAKLAARARGAPPGDWAGFTVVGDPLTRVPVTAPAPRRHRGWLAAGGLLLAGLAVYGVRRRRGRSSDRRSGDPTVDTHH